MKFFVNFRMHVVFAYHDSGHVSVLFSSDVVVFERLYCFLVRPLRLAPLCPFSFVFVALVVTVVVRHSGMLLFAFSLTEIP